MTQEELKMALELHKKWLSNESDGVRLDLWGEDLRCIDLSHANLSHANLKYADLSYANLSGTKLRGADLSGTDLIGANLSGADLRWAHTINTEGIDVICVQLNTSDKNRQIQYYVQLNKVTAGCFSGTLDELKKAVREKHDKDSIIYKRYQIAFKTIEDILETY